MYKNAYLFLYNCVNLGKTKLTLNNAVNYNNIVICKNAEWFYG